MSLVMLLPLTASLLARADTITLDTGATIQGDLARFEFGGDCQISVTEGELKGVIVIVPCQRVESFARTTQRLPSAIRVSEPDGSATVRGSGDSATAAGPATILPVATVGSVVVAPSGRPPPGNARLPAAAPPDATPPDGAEGPLVASPMTSSPFDDDGFFDEEAAGAAIPVDDLDPSAPPATLQPRSTPSLIAPADEASTPRRTVQF